MKNIIRIISVSYFIIVIPSIMWAQQNDKADSVNIQSLMSSASSDSTWDNSIWARVQEMTAKNRLFNENVSDRIVDTGTRAKEFEEGEGQQFYIKKENKTTESDQIITAIKILEDNVAEELYLIEKCYSKIGDTRKAAEIRSIMTTRYPNAIWTKLLQKEQVDK